MTKQEFIKQKELFEKRFEQNDIFYAVLFVAVLLVNWLVVSHFGSFIESRIVVYLFLLSVTLLICFRWIKNRQQREIMHSDLRCSACHGLLTGDLADIALATDYCPKCGQHAFDPQEVQ